MPNWVINRIRIEGENAFEILKSHIIVDERGTEQFDFNTIERMPEDLKIEKSSRSADGLKLYIAKINPLMSEIGSKEDKYPSMKEWIEKMLSLFGHDCMDRMDRYILKSDEIKRLRLKYGNDFDAVIELGSKVFKNYENYGTPDWYEWSCSHWGTKWNSCNTYFVKEENTVFFDTAWSPSTEVIAKFSKLHENVKIIHEYAEEQTGFMSGRLVYKQGNLIDESQFDPFSKEAYEMSFDLWGNGEEYRFNEDTNTYEYAGNELEDSL